MRTLFLTLTTCLFALPADAAWPLYEPIAEVVLPPGDANVPRAVEEKEGYVYLLAREGILYTYDLSDLPLRTSFTTYSVPVYQQTCDGNGSGVLRHGDYLYAFGGGGIQTIDVRDPNRPVLLGLRSDLNIYNLVRHESYLLAAGAERLVVYSIAEPSNPTLVSELNLGPEQLVWSAAGYGRTLYACHWWSDWQGTYVDTLSIIDFSDPAHLTVLKALKRDDEAYHLRVMGNRLLECTSNQVGLWDLTAPANPVLLTSQVAGARVAALSGDHLVTNGAVFRPDGNDLQVVASFKAGGNQGDGSPYGSAANDSFVFIAQSKRVLILNARPPVLAINYARGGPGSFFTITGHGFPPKGKATILVNGHTLGEVAADAAGDCLFLLNTQQAGPGHYVVTTTAHPDTSASFAIAAGEPVRPQEGSGMIFQTPPGIAYAKYSGGNGTAPDPYRIATAADLIALGETPADYDKHFILTADIDLDPNLPGRKVFDRAVIAPDTNPNDSPYEFQGIPFTGVFDGNGHRISHLIAKGRRYLGLFGQIESRAELRDIRAADVNIAGSGNYIGGLVGSNGRVGNNDGHVTRCYSTGRVSGDIFVGGLVGLNYGTVTQCYSTDVVSGNNTVGGLVALNWGSVTHCHSTGAVSGGHDVGGLVGHNEGIVSCSDSGGRASGGYNVGGLVGENGFYFGGFTTEPGPGWFQPGTIFDCHSTATVLGTGSNCGGLAGINVGYCRWEDENCQRSTISNCYAAGKVDGNDCVGGLVGKNDGGINQCYSTGAVSGTGWGVGGLVGSNAAQWGEGVVTGSVWDRQTSGRTESAGGTGKTTAEMQTARTFLDGGWDFVGETANGTQDLWRILEGKDYPRLWWELKVKP